MENPPTPFRTRFALPLAAVLLLTALPLAAREKDAALYGAGLIVNVPLPAQEVTQVVDDVAHNGIIRGSKEYNKDEYISGADDVPSSKVFPAWTAGGKVFYKERRKALNPRNFKDSGDLGTLAVRYIVQEQGEKNTLVRIDAIFVEDFRRAAHASNGSVENAEYKDIREQLDAIELAKQQATEAERKQQTAQVDPISSSAETVAQNSEPASQVAAVEIVRPQTATAAATATPAADSLEEHVRELRRQLEWLVKAPGAPLKSSPFRSARTLQSLSAGSEVLILISTTYWYGVETHDGQHGWIARDDLEQLP
jgi:hypothetical protein